MIGVELARYVSIYTVQVLSIPSDVLYKFIVGWFNHHGKKNAKTESQEAGLALLNAISKNNVRKPVKSGVIVAYQREYYDSRIRDDFEHQWNIETTKWQEALIGGNTEGLDPPIKLKVRTQVARAAWDRESQEFKDTFIKANENQHSEILELFERRNELPETPEDYA